MSLLAVGGRVMLGESWAQRPCGVLAGVFGSREQVNVAKKKTLALGV